MLRLILLRFWPVLLPLLFYAFWMLHCQRKAEKTGQPVPAFKDGPWVLAVTATMILAIIGFVLLRTSSEALDGTYIPAHMENGKLVPAEIQNAH